MMTPTEEAQLRNASQAMKPGTRVRLLETRDGRSAEMAEFCKRLAALVPQVALTREEGDGNEHPLILLPNGVRYQGIPRGNEMSPFLQALAGQLPPLSDRLRTRLEAAVHAPAELDLFVTPQCTFCPGVVRRVMPLALASRRIRLTVVDAFQFPEIAKHRGVQAVPTLLLDGQFRWTGDVPLEEVVDLLSTRDPASMGPAALEMLLKEGAARHLARMMADRHRVFPALIELLCHEQWPVRLGAMVAIEELNALAPDLGREAIDTLWDRFESVSDAVKGDILFLCGEIGGPQIAASIRAVLRGGASEEVREAAEEALAKLG